MTLSGEEAIRAIADPKSVEADDAWAELLREVLADDARSEELLMVLTDLFGFGRGCCL
ncbi:MAG: hypothetical protein WD834_05820 [Actinomycetota bacterium]